MWMWRPATITAWSSETRPAGPSISMGAAVSRCPDCAMGALMPNAKQSVRLSSTCEAERLGPMTRTRAMVPFGPCSVTLSSAANSPCWRTYFLTWGAG